MPKTPLTFNSGVNLLSRVRTAALSGAESRPQTAVTKTQQRNREVREALQNLMEIRKNHLGLQRQHRKNLGKVAETTKVPPQKFGSFLEEIHARELEDTAELVQPEVKDYRLPLLNQ